MACNRGVGENQIKIAKQNEKLAREKAKNAKKK